MKKLIKTSFILFLCLHHVIMVQAQSFVFRLYNPLTRVFTYPSIEYKDCYYVPYYESAVSRNESNDILSFFQPQMSATQDKNTDGFRVLKINKTGTYYDIFYVDTFDVNNNITLFELKPGDNCIEMFGTCKNLFTQELSVFSMQLDTNFNPLFRKSTVLPDNKADNLIKVLANNPNKIYMALMGKSPYNKPYVSIAEVDSNFMLTQFYKFDSLQFFTPVILKIVEFDTCLILTEYYQSYMYRISKSNFAIFDTVDMSAGHTPMSYTFFKYSDSTFLNPQLFRPMQISWPPDSTSGVIIIERNIDLFTVDSLVFYSYDTSQMAGITSLDMRTPDSLFFAGAYNSSTEFIMENFDNWLMVYNLNWSTKEINWIKYYGGDAFYYCFHLLATSDGGCLVSAGFHDWRMSTAWDYDLFLLKLDANGYVLSDKSDLPQPEGISFTLYPNPATGNMRLQFDKINYTGDFRYSVYDMQGRLRITSSAPMQNGSCNINVSLLGAGAYFLVSEDAPHNIRIPFVKL